MSTHAYYITFLFAAFSAVIAWPIELRAGTITLQNGNVIEGTIAKIEKTQVKWAIALAGTVSIKKEDVVFLESRQKLRLKGKKRPCYWDSFDGAVVEFSCEDGSSELVPFLSIENLVPFVGFQQSINFDRGNLSLLGSEESGNFQRRNIQARGRYEWRRLDWRHDLQASFQRETFVGDNSLKRGAYEYGVDWFFKPQWFLYLDNRYEQDDSQALDHRQLHGLGFGYQFFETVQTALSLETGFSYVDEEFTSANGGAERTRRFEALVLTTRYRLALPYGFRFTTDGNISVGFNSAQNYQTRGGFSLYLPVIKGISTEVRYELRFDNNPVGDINTVDRTLRLGLNYSWGS